MRLLHRISLFTILLVLLPVLNEINAKCIYQDPVRIKKMEVGNMLSWSTYQEVDNKFFVIEKSSDGIKFKKVGDVEGAGYSSSVRAYRFLDFALGDKKSFYRILHYDSRGNYTVSETFLTERSTENNLMITSMTSTLTDKKFSVTMKSIKETEVIYELRPYNGAVFKKGKKKLTKGLNVLAFDLSNLPEGRFQVILTNGQEKEKINIKKVKTSDVPKVDYEVRKDKRFKPE